MRFPSCIRYLFFLHQILLLRVLFHFLFCLFYQSVCIMFFIIAHNLFHFLCLKYSHSFTDCDDFCYFISFNIISKWNWSRNKRNSYLFHTCLWNVVVFLLFYCALLLLFTVVLVSNKSLNEMEINRVSIYFSCFNWPELLLIGI